MSDAEIKPTGKTEIKPVAKAETKSAATAESKGSTLYYLQVASFFSFSKCVFTF